MIAGRGIEAGPVNWEGCRAHTSQLGCTGRGCATEEEDLADESRRGKNVMTKFGFFKWKKKNEKRKNRTKTELLLINMIKLDHFGIVVFGFWSEMFRSAPYN